MMTMMRWSPWQELESMNNQLSRMLENNSTAFGSESEQWAPSVDIRETDDALLVQAELPGIEKKDVHLEVRDGVLTRPLQFIDVSPCTHKRSLLRTGAAAAALFFHSAGVSDNVSGAAKQIT